MKRLPTYFLSHGGGPWPYLTGPFREHYRQLEASLKDVARELGDKPEAVLVVSGHWEAAEFTVMANPHPGMIYDYYGFPDHTYEVQYAAPGAPALAGRVQHLLAAAGIAARLDEKRGFDHGCFTPLAVMYPDADVPVMQLSLKTGYDPQAHLAAGRALAPLRDEGVLILGSGLSYHNLREFGGRRGTLRRCSTPGCRTSWCARPLRSVPACCCSGSRRHRRGVHTRVKTT